MNELKKYSTSLSLIGIFLLPAMLNIFHFLWVDHENSDVFFDSNEEIIYSTNSKDHNCEQFFFKVPASESLNLSYQEIKKTPEYGYRNSFEILSFIYKKNKQNDRLLRGPPDLSLNSNN